MEKRLINREEDIVDKINKIANLLKGLESITGRIIQIASLIA
jgi:hypothetical protein